MSTTALASNSVSTDDILKIILATPVITAPFTVKTPGVPPIPFGRVQAEDIIKVIYEHPGAREFFFGMWRQKDDITPDALLTGFIELLVRLGSGVVSKIISLATPWPMHPGVVQAIGQWTPADRLRALSVIKNDGEWTGFFEVLLSWMPNESDGSSDSPQIETGMLEAAIASSDRARQPSAESSQPRPDSEHLTQLASLSIHDALQKPPLAEDPGVPLLSESDQSRSAQAA